MYLILEGLVAASIALTGAWFVFFAAGRTAGNLQFAGRILGWWLVVLAVLLLLASLLRPLFFNASAEEVALVGGPAPYGQTRPVPPAPYDVSSPPLMPSAGGGVPATAP